MQTTGTGRSLKVFNKIYWRMLYSNNNINTERVGWWAWERQAGGWGQKAEANHRESRTDRWSLRHYRVTWVSSKNPWESKTRTENNKGVARVHGAGQTICRREPRLFSRSWLIRWSATSLKPSQVTGRKPHTHTLTRQGVRDLGKTNDRRLIITDIEWNIAVQLDLTALLQHVNQSTLSTAMSSQIVSEGNDLSSV